MKKTLLFIFGLFCLTASAQTEYRFGNGATLKDTVAIVAKATDPTAKVKINATALSPGAVWDIIMPDRNINLGSFDATNIANGTVSNTAFQYIANLAQDAQEQIDSKFNITGGTITGNINFGNSFKAINLADPVNPQDAVTLNHLNNTFGANNLKSEPASRTNEETYSNVIGQPYADSQSDGAAPSGTLVLEFDVPPAFLATGTTLNMDDYRGYNSSISASTAYTLDVAEVGGFVYAFVNAASEPSFTGTGITVINPVDSLAFIPNDNMLAIVWMLTSTTAMQWWIDIP